MVIIRSGRFAAVGCDLPRQISTKSTTCSSFWGSSQEAKLGLTMLQKYSVPCGDLINSPVPLQLMWFWGGLCAAEASRPRLPFHVKSKPTATSLSFPFHSLVVRPKSVSLSSQDLSRPWGLSCLVSHFPYCLTAVDLAQNIAPSRLQDCPVPRTCHLDPTLLGTVACL